jgi:hypothetical protein
MSRRRKWATVLGIARTYRYTPSSDHNDNAAASHNNHTSADDNTGANHHDNCSYNNGSANNDDNDTGRGTTHLL